MRLFRRTIVAAFALALSLAALATLGPETRYALDGHAWAWSLVALGVVLWFVGLWGAIWAVAGRNPLGARHPDRLRQPPRRYLGARLALGWVALIGIFLSSGLPWPPGHPDEWRASGVLWTSIVGALVAAVTLARRRPLGRWLAVIGGACGLVSLSLGVYGMRAANIPLAGAGVIWSLLITGSLFVMWIVAAIVVLSAWRAWPPRDVDAASPVGWGDAGA